MADESSKPAESRKGDSLGDDAEQYREIQFMLHGQVNPS